MSARDEEGEGTDLDDDAKVVGREAVAQDALDVGAHDLEVDEDLEDLGEIDAREAEQVRLGCA